MNKEELIEKLSIHESEAVLNNMIIQIKSIDKPNATTKGTVLFVNGIYREVKKDGLWNINIVAEDVSSSISTIYGSNLSLSKLIIDSVDKDETIKLLEVYMECLEKANNGFHSKDIKQAAYARRAFIDNLNEY